MDEIQTLFKSRTRTIDVKGNKESSSKANLWCMLSVSWGTETQLWMSWDKKAVRFQWIQIIEVWNDLWTAGGAGIIWKELSLDVQCQEWIDEDFIFTNGGPLHHYVCWCAPDSSVIVNYLFGANKG